MVKRVSGFSRVEFIRLKTDHDRLCEEVEALRRNFEAQRRELQVQFKRIAEMQAILDEERMANDRLLEPRTLISARG